MERREVEGIKKKKDEDLTGKNKGSERCHYQRKYKNENMKILFQKMEKLYILFSF